MSRVVRLGVIGCGAAAWIGHLPWIWEHPEARLAAVCDPDSRRAEEARQRFQVPDAVADYRDLLARPDVDAVCVCTPPATHAEIAVAAARHGKHVLVEKPMARSVAECDDMAAAARKHGVVLMVGHEKRFNLALETVRRQIDEGELGRVFYLDVHWGASVKLDPARLIPDGYRDSYTWRWRDPAVGGGILQDHLPHYVDLWRWWTGAEVVTVCAEVQNVTRDLLGDPDLGRWEDFGTVLMRFTNGAVGVFNTGTVGHGLSPILHLGSGIGGWSEFGYLHGTRGHLVFDLPPWDSPEHGRLMIWSLGRTDRHGAAAGGAGSDVSISADKAAPADAARGWYEVALPEPRRCPGGPRSPVTNETFMFRRQIDHFIHCVQSGTEPLTGPRDGRATLAVIEAVYESQRSGRKTPVAG